MTDKIADRPYLGSYVDSILTLADGPVRLGRMISAAETSGEILNYTAEHIRLSTKGLLFCKPLHDFEKFAQVVSRDKERWPAVKEAFSEHIGAAYDLLVQSNDTYNVTLLRKICNGNQDLKVIFDGMLSAREATSAASLNGITNPQPS